MRGGRRGLGREGSMCCEPCASAVWCASAVATQVLRHQLAPTPPTVPATRRPHRLAPGCWAGARLCLRVVSTPLAAKSQYRVACCHTWWSRAQLMPHHVAIDSCAGMPTCPIPTTTPRFVLAHPCHCFPRTLIACSQWNTKACACPALMWVPCLVILLLFFHARCTRCLAISCERQL